jgi:RNA polymerase sigma-70 factor (ECF subfamily)
MDPSSVFSISSHSSEENREVLAPLLAKAKRGEQEAFGEIYNLYFKKIYQFIFYRVSAKEIAEDLTEDVFLKAFTKIASLKEDVTFAGWLYQIARNKVIDHYREKKIVVALDEVENTLEYESNIIDVVNLEQQQKVLLKFMKELTSEQQVVLKLKFFEDLDNAEIADAIGKNEGAVRVIQHRAITKLQELISQSGVNNG